MIHSTNRPALLITAVCHTIRLAADLVPPDPAGGNDGGDSSEQWVALLIDLADTGEDLALRMALGHLPREGKPVAALADSWLRLAATVLRAALLRALGATE